MTRIESGTDPKDKDKDKDKDKKDKDKTLGESAGGAHTRDGVERIEIGVSDITEEEPSTKRQERKQRKKLNS